VSIAMRDAFGLDSPQTDRVVHNTRRILRLMEKYEVKGTFFVLGRVGTDFPYLVKEIHSSGHEIGVHGNNHITFNKLNPARAFTEISEAKAILENIIGESVIGHRAPAFSITPETSWALETVKEAGFQYDSSILPVSFGTFCWPGANEDFYRVPLKNHDSLIEVPISVVKIFGKKFPFSGGSYFRLLPWPVFSRFFKLGLNKRPQIFYMHPYEVDFQTYPDYYMTEYSKSSYINKVKLKSTKWRRESVEVRLSNLFENYCFTSIRNLLD